MKIQSLIRRFERWKASRNELLRQVEALSKEIDRLERKVATLKEKVTGLQQAKVQAEMHAEGRRKEKEALRSRLTNQKKASESNDLLLEQLGAKITELRAENDRLRRSRKRKSGPSGH